jgi:hypothetical protein
MFSLTGSERVFDGNSSINRRFRMSGGTFDCRFSGKIRTVSGRIEGYTSSEFSVVELRECSTASSEGISTVGSGELLD